MNPDIGRAGVRIALLLIVPSAILLLLEPRDSPEFAISALTLGIGLALLGAVAILLLRIRR